jgi:hypothetical protein
MSTGEATSPSLGPRDSSHALLDSGALAVAALVALMASPVFACMNFAASAYT